MALPLEMKQIAKNETRVGLSKNKYIQVQTLMFLKALLTQPPCISCDRYRILEHGNRYIKINTSSSLIKNTAAGEGDGAKRATGVSFV